MKTYKVKNYKGNLVESLSKFQKSHKGMKILEACEDGDDLKIKAEAKSLPYDKPFEKFLDTIKRCLKDNLQYCIDTDDMDVAQDFIEDIIEILKNNGSVDVYIPELKEQFDDLLKSVEKSF